MTSPNPPTGSSAEANWLRRLLAFAVSLTPLNGRGYKVKRAVNGWWFEFDTGGGAPLKISTYKFESEGADYIMCRPWDGSLVNMAGSPTAIAKPDSLRNAIATERIDSIVWTYTYGSSPNQRRTAVGGGITENQVITPRYLPYELDPAHGSTDPLYGTLTAFKGSTIWAVSASTFALDQAGASISLIDLNLGGRAWAAES